jgi:hypothetical protein
MLITLKQIIMGGEARRVLVSPEAIYYVSNEDGTGSIVSTMIGTIRVMETPQEIKDKVSSKTQAHGASTE